MKIILIVIILLSFLIIPTLMAGTEKNNVSSTEVLKKDNPEDKPVTVTSPMAGETITWQVISGGGNAGISTGYKLSGTAGQTAVGSGVSASYGVSHGYWQIFDSGSNECCVGVRGDANCSGDEPDISDITRLIDYLYLSHAPLCCAEEADVNASGGEPDISDITRLIDYLYLSQDPLAACP